MKNTAQAVAMARNPRPGRMPEHRSSTLPNLITLAAVFIFYMMLAITFGIAVLPGCILAATGAAAIAWTTPGGAGARRKAGLATVEIPSESHPQIDSRR